jgi:hypothetical protein
VQLLLGHSKLESTARYLGIELDDALEMAERTEVYSRHDRSAAACRSLTGQKRGIRGGEIAACEQ